MPSSHHSSTLSPYRAYAFTAPAAPPAPPSRNFSIALPKSRRVRKSTLIRMRSSKVVN